MQLELFNIRTEDTPPKGKVGKAAGRNPGAAADGKTGATQGTGDDFLSFLRRVSKENQENTGDIPPAASGPDLSFDGEQSACLDDILDEIMRAWPAGKRPTGLMGAGDELPDAGTPADLATKAGWGLALTDPGKDRQSIARVRRASAGFTTALIKRPNGAQAEAGLTTTGAGKAASLESAAADRATLPAGNPGKGNGISIPSMAAVRSAGRESMPVKGVDVRGLDKDETATEKSVTRKHGADLKGEPRVSHGRTVSLRTAGENAAWEVERNTAAPRKPKNARPATSENQLAGNRPVVKEAAIKDVPVDSKLTGGQNHANDMKLAGRPSNPATEANSLQKSSAEGVAVFKSEVDRSASEQTRVAAKSMSANETVAERVLDSKPVGGEQAVRFTPAPDGATRFVKEPGIKRKNPDQQKIPDGREGEDLRQLATREAKKNPAAMERDGALKSNMNLSDKERFGNDSTIGQAARDQKGGDQPRFEVADARIKPVDTAVPTPKSQPLSSGVMPSEPEKPILDRVSQAKVLEQITAKIKMQPKKGGSEIRIHLKPEALGQVQLKVMTQDQNVTVKMVAETAMARDIIENNVGQLRADLNALGLNVEKLDVDVFTNNDPGDKHSAEQRGSHTGNGRGAAQHGSRDGELSDRARQMHAAEDEADGGNLIGVFA